MTRNAIRGNLVNQTKAIWAISGVLLAITLFYMCKKKAAPALASATTAASGPSVAWKFQNDRTTFATITLGPDGTIYAGSNQGVFAISPDGKLKWQAQYGGISYTALGSDGMLYAASMYGLPFGVSPDGSVSWKPGYGLIGFHAPPATSTGKILYANTTSDLYAFEPGATTALWSQNTFRGGALSPNSSLPGTATVGQNSAASPVIYSDDSIALPRQHWVTMFGSDGTPAWSVEVTPGDLGAAALGEDGTVYTSDGGAVYAVDRDGSIGWKYPAAAGTCCVGSPATDMDGTIYFAGSRSLTALGRDGRLKWSVSSKHAFETGPALVADGSIYIGATDGLVAFEPDGSEKWVAASPNSLTTPAISADGTAYYVCGYIWVCAVRGINSPLMKSSWPRIYHDSANTGNILTQF